MDLHRPEVLTSGGDLFKIFRTGSVNKKPWKLTAWKSRFHWAFHPNWCSSSNLAGTLRFDTSKMWMAKIHAATPMYRHIKIALQGRCVEAKFFRPFQVKWRWVKSLWYLAFRFKLPAKQWSLQTKKMWSDLKHFSSFIWSLPILIGITSLHFTS